MLDTAFSMSDIKPEVKIFCDGGCRGNPGPGGWAVILRRGGREKELSGYKGKTTNNEMELTAAIEGLKALTKPCKVTVTTDSKYVAQGMTTWIFNWMKNNWRTAGRKPVKNQELWKALLAAAAPHDVTWVWVKGHSGHPENERADRLVNETIDKNS